jgi:hypothetical protein
MTVYSYNSKELKERVSSDEKIKPATQTIFEEFRKLPKEEKKALKVFIVIASFLATSAVVNIVTSTLLIPPVAEKTIEQPVKVTTPPVDDFQKKWEEDQARLGAEQAERERKWEEGKAQREKEAADREYEAIAALPLAERQSVCTNRSHPYYSAYRDACAKFYSQF